MPLFLHLRLRALDNDRPALSITHNRPLLTTIPTPQPPKATAEPTPTQRAATQEFLLIPRTGHKARSLLQRIRVRGAGVGVVVRGFRSREEGWEGFHEEGSDAH